MPVAPQELFYSAFPKEGWVTSLEETDAILSKIQELSGGNTEYQARALYMKPESARGLFWHLPGGVVINFLLHIEKDHGGTMRWLATEKASPEDFVDDLHLPGGDIDARRRYIERIRFSAAQTPGGNPSESERPSGDASDPKGLIHDLPILFWSMPCLTNCLALRYSLSMGLSCSSHQ